MALVVHSGTLHAGAGQVAFVRIREGLSVGQFINAHPGDASEFVRFVRPERDIVLREAGHHAGAATGAFIQVNDHSISFGFVVSFIHHNLVASVS
jgi:hypothetical protein